MVLQVETLGALVVASLAAWFDYRTRRIPNWLTVGALVVGLLVTTLAGFGIIPSSNPISLGNALATVGVTFVVTLLGFTSGLLGGGDTKLLVALGAWLGFPAIVEVAIYSLLGAVAMFVIACIAQGRLARCLKSIGATLGGILLPGLRKHADPELMSMRLPFGVAICAAVLAWSLQLALGIGSPLI